MEQLIHEIINNYSHLVAEEAMFEHHLEARENSEMRDALTLHKIKIGTIESWFTLLNVDEKVILRQALIDSGNATAPNRIAATRWAQSLMCNGLSPWKLKEQSIQKIVAFSNAHREIMCVLFGK